jgi:hypothetical protein
MLYTITVIQLNNINVKNPKKFPKCMSLQHNIWTVWMKVPYLIAEMQGCCPLGAGSSARRNAL